MVSDVIKFRETVADYFSLKELLIRDEHLYESGSNNIFCPFHNDEEDRSATYFPEDDLLWCYRDKRQYSSYDYLSQIDGFTDEEIKQKLPDGINFEDTEVEKGTALTDNIKSGLDDIEDRFKNGRISVEKASSLIIRLLG